MVDDVYSSEQIAKEHSLRYIHIVSRNVVGILNRICSLMRRKRYNIEDISVAFDDDNKAHITLAVDGRILDVQQIIYQINKLHDVFSVNDVTSHHDQIYHAFYVRAKTRGGSEFKDFPIEPMRIVCDPEGCKGIFMATLMQAADLSEYLNTNEFHYIRRIISMI